jgi:ribonuclease P protein component
MWRRRTAGPPRRGDSTTAISARRGLSKGSAGRISQLPWKTCRGVSGKQTKRNERETKGKRKAEALTEKGTRETLYTGSFRSRTRDTTARLKRDEANLSAKETQACTHARVPCADANACRPAHDQAPSQEGAHAAHRLAELSVERPRGATRRRPRLSRSADFQRVYRRGESVASRHFVLYAFPREDSSEEAGREDSSAIRFGVSVGRRVGGAVERNRVKRLLREAFWGLGEQVSPRHDYVVVARRGAAEAAESGGVESFKADLAALLERLELDRESNEAAGP